MLDKLVKEMGNSIYGKIAQGVAGTRIIKDDIDRQSVFNTMFGVSEPLGPSAITNAMMAAYCYRTGQGIAAGDDRKAARGVLGRDGNHRRLSVDVHHGRCRPERADGACLQGGARAHHAG